MESSNGNKCLMKLIQLADLGLTDPPSFVIEPTQLIVTGTTTIPVNTECRFMIIK